MEASPGLLAEVEAVAEEAAALILEVYATDFAVLGKADASPVTVADERAEAHLVAALQRLAPGVPVVAEEAAARGEVPAVGARFWLVDPLDGTREFVSRNGEFTVNIALVEDGSPVLGVVQVPVQRRRYAGLVGQGAWCEDAEGRRAITCRAVPPVGELVVASSRSHGDEAALRGWLAGQGLAGRPLRHRAAGSSLKFGLLACGEADLYPRLGRTMEWDTAAGHAVLRAAGGEVCMLDGAPLRYGKPGFENPHFVARGAA
ncbi:MAG: 3'(2'),5'-bisphosphate nucleotidase CysQ [Betaproteobacteria bacterium]